MNEQNENIDQPVPDVDEFILGVAQGAYDDDLRRITEALLKRREALKESIRERVRELFGRNAEIVVEKRNPFVDRSRPAPPPEPKGAMEIWREGANKSEDDDDEVQGDALSIPFDVESPEKNLDRIEDRLNAGQQPPIEQRGAIIGGISSTDIGE
jgi:hypothetical protein